MLRQTCVFARREHLIPPLQSALNARTTQTSQLKRIPVNADRGSFIFPAVSALSAKLMKNLIILLSNVNALLAL